MACEIGGNVGYSVEPMYLIKLGNIWQWGLGMK